MATTAKDIMALIKEQDVQMVDFKIVDIDGQFRHVTIPATNFNEDTMKNGIGFDASNYGYAVVEKSDMVYIPDLETAMIDPFCSVKTLSMIGNAMIIDYPQNRPLAQYPRNIVQAAVQYMKDSGIADEMKILPEFEFYLFNQVGWKVDRGIPRRRSGVLEQRDRRTRLRRSVPEALSCCKAARQNVRVPQRNVPRNRKGGHPREVSSPRSRRRRSV